MKSMRFSIFVLAAALALVNTAMAQSRPELPEVVQILRDHPYEEDGHVRNRLDLYLPKNALEKNAAPLPVVVWIHGGAWWAGNKDGCPAVWLTGKGYAVASINYRLSQHAVFPAQIEDCKAAVRWLRGNAGKHHLDPDHIGVWGASAGGHLVALLGTTGGAKELDGKGGNADQSSRVQCVVDWFGPTDLAQMQSLGDKPDTPIAKLLGGTMPDNREKAKKASPLFYVTKDSAPFLIMHGDKDNLVPLKQSEVLAEALAKAGVEVKLQVIKDNGHGGPGFNTPESRKLIEEFFDKHLKGNDGGGKAGAIRSKLRVLVTSSKETTYITGPLRKDGYVDYLAALNERFKKGVTPENNAAVLFWQAMGPGEILEQKRASFFKSIGIAQPPEQGDYWISQWRYVAKLKDPKDWQDVTLSDEDFTEGTSQLFTAMQRPWSEQEFPKIAGWLSANEKPLALLVQASKRSRYYDPHVSGDSEGGMTAALFPNAGNLRDVARALVARAMLRLKQDLLSEAWDDLLACHRLARLTGQSVGVIGAVSAAGLDRMALDGDLALLRHIPLNRAQATKMRRDLGTLPSLPQISDRIDLDERYVFLDLVATLSRRGMHLMKYLQCDIDLWEILQDGVAPGTMDNSMWGHVTSTVRTTADSFWNDMAPVVIDWDTILRMGNTCYDRVADAGRRRTRIERRNDLLKVENDIKAKNVAAKNPVCLGVSLLFNGPQKTISERTGSILLGVLVPPLSACFNAIDASNARFEVTCLGFALAAYHADHGAYPEQLTDLAPKYVAKVPGDIFANDGPLHYKRHSTGYVLYSVGPNGNDDGGRGSNYRKEGENCDDISIHVP